MAAEIAIHPAMASHGGAAAIAPVAEEASELIQCEKLVRFRVEILAGLHPRIKPPTSTAKPSTANRQASPTVNSVPDNRAGGDKPAAINGNVRHASENHRSFHANAQKPVQNLASAPLPGLGALSHAANNSLMAGIASRSDSRKARIEPVLLEKSDDLIRAELTLQRQRIERALREQLQQQRNAEMNLAQEPDFLTCINVAGIMTKAVADSQSRDIKSTDALAANASVASDSFDDNTFYSSQHDTPDSYPVSRLPNDSEQEEMRDGSPYEPQFDPDPVHEPIQTRQAQPSAPPPLSAAQTSVPAQPPAPSPAAPRCAVPGLTSLKAAPQAHNPPTGPRNTRPDISGPSNAMNSQSSLASSAQTNRRADSMQTSGDAGRSTVNQEPLGSSRHSRKLDGRLLDPRLGRHESPVVRAHNLSPVAPQPAHVSPLAVARQPLLTQHDSVGTVVPAQIVALRNQRYPGSSPETSSTTSKPGEKKKNKKKKKKAERLAAEVTAASPEIKDEPQSLSPPTAQADARPIKRQKRGMTHDRAPAHNGSRYAEPITIDDGYEDEHHPRARLAPRAGYELREEYGPYPRVLRPASEYYYNHGRPASILGAESTSSTYPSYPGPADYPRARVAPHAYLEPQHRETTAFYREPRDSASYAPEAGRSRSPVILARHRPMLPPRAPVARVMLNEYGEEVYEIPGRSARVGRESLAPVARDGESDRGYGPLQLPGLATSRERDTFEKDGMMYPRMPSTYSAPRRVFTQPEPLQHHAYADREYSVRPMGPPGLDYTRLRRAGEREVTEMPREYMVCAASTRPPPGPEQYDPIGSYERVPLDEQARMYPSIRATSVRPSLESAKYQVPAGYERRVLNADSHDALGKFPLMRSASVRPGETVRILDGPVAAPSLRRGSVKPETQTRDHDASGHRDVQRGYMPPPPLPSLPPPAVEGRAYSVHPTEGAPRVDHQRFEARPVKYYYPQAPGDGEAMYVADPPWMPY